MQRLQTGTRIALVLTMWSTTALLCLRMMGVWDDGYTRQLTARTKLCESVAVSCSEFHSRGDIEGVEVVLASLVSRNSDVLSAAVRNQSGTLTSAFGDHQRNWRPTASGRVSSSCIYVPVMSGADPIGRIEVSFTPLMGNGLLGILAMPTVRVISLATLINLFVFAYCLRRCFRFLDPNQVVPDRVRSALDTVADSLLILDKESRIVLVNRSFCDVTGKSSDELCGRRMAELDWHGNEDEEIDPRRFWDATKLVNNDQATDATIKISLSTEQRGERTFLVNSSEIRDDDNVSRGTLVSLNDVTVLDSQNEQLQQTLVTLRETQEAIQQQNEQLHFLATRDPLTGCMNRRAFFDHMGKHWNAFERGQLNIACVMVDVDHFKSINDTYGHAMGDEVLRRVAGTLLSSAREYDLVCRYGGEEFCVMLPHTDLDGARQAAERFRLAIERLPFNIDLTVTASLGVSDTSCGPANVEHLIEQADGCLYEAKRNGRNRAVVFDSLARADTY
ncbi:MAG: sensor domain-containing diguanylate cyclase [Pirellulaceae bacterium]|nr:GGDEF domain-containing protein [Planctomycetales bacterium]